MTTRSYEIQITGRGEIIKYSDNDVELSIERTYIDGHRLYCNSISGEFSESSRPFNKRQEVIENLCDYFETKTEPSIFVLDEADIDRADLENLFSDLVSKGHKITLEYDSAKKREQAQDEMHIGTLEAAKKISINGVEINSVEEYRRWKNNN